MRDFTLIIPTYNRQEQLRSLLFFLKVNNPYLRVLVLDSSREEYRHANKAVVSPTEYVEYPRATHPFDKFLDGVNRCQTEYCALCADDDVMLLDGVEQCIEVLRNVASVSVVRGHGFSFQWTPEEGEAIYLTNDRWIPPNVRGTTPMERLAKLFGSYQAATYGIYRTAQLRHFMSTSACMTSLLGRELLATALAAATGPMVTVPVLTHGRSMGKSVDAYCNWHPLEYFANGSDDMAREYQVYRGALCAAVLASNNTLTSLEVKRALDLIHLRYLLQNAPDDVLKFIIDRKVIGAKPEGYLSPEAQKALLIPAMPERQEMTDQERNALAERLAKYTRRVLPWPDQVERVERN